MRKNTINSEPSQAPIFSKIYHKKREHKAPKDKTNIAHSEKTSAKADFF